MGRDKTQNNKQYTNNTENYKINEIMDLKKRGLRQRVNELGNHFQFCIDRR